MLFPISKLIEGRQSPICVSRDTTIREALTLMVENDYSQLPVLNQDGNLSGLVSETSIMRMYYHVGASVSLLDLRVDNCQTNAVTLAPDRDIFEALDLLRYMYAIVIVQDAKPVGILTNYDTTHFFRDLSEGLILVEDIEVGLRQRIEAAFPTETTRQAALFRAFGHDKKDATKPGRRYEELSFGEHTLFVTTEENWPRFGETLAPKQLFSSLMEQVRPIRNQLSHFRGRLAPVQRDVLLRARDWLASRPTLVTTESLQQQTVHVSPSEIPAGKPADTYSHFGNWLAKRTRGPRIIKVSFADIEALLQEPLPPSARQYHSWWDNDPASNVQALAWMGAGWRVDDADLVSGQVVFHRTNSVRKHLFFDDLLRRLKEARPGITAATRTFAQSWWSFSAGKTGFSFGWAFTNDRSLRVELYIDTGDKAKNKGAFDALCRLKEEIEQKVGCTLVWERLEQKRASRISLARPAAITDSPDALEGAKVWAVETMLKFADTFGPRIREL